MSKFPEPPAIGTLHAVGPILHTLPVGALLWRVYFQAGGHPTTWESFRSFGPTFGRFDHQLPPPRPQPDRAILYTAEDGLTCMAEVFQDTRRIHRTRGSPALVAFATTRPLVLLDLTGHWPTRAGASSAIASGSRRRAQRWSRAIFAAFPDVDGLHYGSSMNGNVPCQALYARAQDALPPHPTVHRRLDDPVLHTAMLNTADRLRYGLI